MASNAPVILEVGANNGSGTFSGLIKSGTTANGALSLAKDGTGTETLTGANTYIGGTTVSGGTLQLGNISALGTGGLTANNGTVDLAGFSPTVSTLNGAAGTITSSMAVSASLTVSGTNSGTFSGTIEDDPNLSAGSAPVSLILSGGELSLTGTNTYSGGTLVSSGTLALANSEAIAAGSSLTVGNASMFALAQGGAAPGAVSAVPEPGTLVLLTAGGLLTVFAVRRRRKP